MRCTATESFLLLVALWLLPFAATASEVADEACVAISDKLASIDLDFCKSLGMTGFERKDLSAIARSVDGFPILLREYPPLAGRKPRGRVLIIGGTHGDELSSISVVMKWMDTLSRHHSGLFHWRILPLLNPDGALARKSTRVNARGVDLNRNFETPGFEHSALEYWAERTGRNPRRYPGPEPLSEPETRWLKQQIEDFRPDIIISVHAPYSLVDFDAPDRKAAPRRIGYLKKNLMGTYPGSLGQYAGIHLGIPVITLELPHAGIMPTRRQISGMWTSLVRWLSRHLPATRMADGENHQG